MFHLLWFKMEKKTNKTTKTTTTTTNKHPIVSQMFALLTRPVRDSSLTTRRNFLLGFVCLFIYLFIFFTIFQHFSLAFGLRLLLRRQHLLLSCSRDLFSFIQDFLMFIYPDQTRGQCQNHKLLLFGEREKTGIGEVINWLDSMWVVWAALSGWPYLGKVKSNKGVQLRFSPNQRLTRGGKQRVLSFNQKYRRHLPIQPSHVKIIIIIQRRSRRI